MLLFELSWIHVQFVYVQWPVQSANGVDKEICAAEKCDGIENGNVPLDINAKEDDHKDENEPELTSPFSPPGKD